MSGRLVYIYPDTIPPTAKVPRGAKADEFIGIPIKKGRTYASDREIPTTLIHPILHKIKTYLMEGDTIRWDKRLIEGDSIGYARPGVALAKAPVFGRGLIGWIQAQNVEYQNRLTKKEEEGYTSSSLKRVDEYEEYEEKLDQLDLEALQAEVEALQHVFVQAGVELPDLNDLWSIRFSLGQLRDRLSSAYRHVPSLGILLSDETQFPEDKRAGVHEALVDIALQNNSTGRSRRKRKPRSPRKSRRGYTSRSDYARPNGGRGRNNPLPQNLGPDLAAYVAGDEKSKDALESSILDHRAAALSQEWKDTTIGALFPREGKPRQSWLPSRRMPEALSTYDLVTRLKGVELPDTADFDPNEPFSSAQAIKYIIDFAGMTVDEAKSLLLIMQQSAGGPKSVKGQAIAIQASSALCKKCRTKKLSNYQPNPKLMRFVGPKAVVILVSPPSDSARVMTWRRGTHLDCDFTSNKPREVVKLIGQALQSAMLWVAEKPGRMKGNRIYIGMIGQPYLREVWRPGMPLSLDSMEASLSGGKALGAYMTDSEAREDKENYFKAVSAMFGVPAHAHGRGGGAGEARTSSTYAETSEAPEAPEHVEEPEAAEQPVGKKPKKPKKQRQKSEDESKFTILGDTETKPSPAPIDPVEAYRQVFSQHASTEVEDLPPSFSKKTRRTKVAGLDEGDMEENEED